MAPAIRDLTGQQFGRLTVVTRSENDKLQGTKWLCQCECGNTKIIFGGALRSGHTKSCGCLRKKVTTKRSQSRPQHKTKTIEYDRTYRCWTSMIQRCTNPKNTGFKAYGGRGITVCDRWLESFRNFYEDMGEAPNGLSLDRIDNNLGYSPDNCRWATKEQQHNNRRDNRFIEFDGQTQTVAQWAREFNIPAPTINSRLRKGATIEEALLKPIKSRKKPCLDLALGATH